MKKAKLKDKLSLNKITIARLSDPETNSVNGGGLPTYTNISFTCPRNSFCLSCSDTAPVNA